VCDWSRSPCNSSMAWNPRFTRRLVHHHVHVVVDDVTAYDRADGRHVEDRRTPDVTLAGVDQVDGLTVDRDLVVVQHLGQHGGLGELAREARRPVLGRLVELGAGWMFTGMAAANRFTATRARKTRTDLVADASDAGRPGNTAAWIIGKRLRDRAVAKRSTLPSSFQCGRLNA
jgi:hypothetical protein